MNGAASRAAAATSQDRIRRGVTRSLRGFGHSLAFSGLVLLGLWPLLAIVLIPVEIQDFVLTVLGLHQSGPQLTQGTGVTPVVLIMCTLLYVRWLADITRRLAAPWCGVLIGRPYRTAPSVPGLRHRLRWLATDPATWRELLWLGLNAVAGTFLVIVPAATALYGFGFALLPGLGVPVWNLSYVGVTAVRGAGAVPLGLALIAVGLWGAP